MHGCAGYVLSTTQIQGAQVHEACEFLFKAQIFKSLVKQTQNISKSETAVLGVVRVGNREIKKF